MRRGGQLTPEQHQRSSLAYRRHSEAGTLASNCTEYSKKLGISRLTVFLFSINTQTPTEWKNIFSNHTSEKSLTSIIYKELQVNKNKAIQKSAQDSKRQVSKDDIQKAHQQVRCSPHHHRRKNSTSPRTASHTSGQLRKKSR